MEKKRMDQKNDPKRELQRKYLEMQYLGEKLQEMQKQMEKIDESLLEIMNAQDTLNDIKVLKKGSELLVPLTNGIFVKANLESTDNLIVNVGAQVTVQKKISEVVKMLNHQAEDALRVKAQLQEQFEELITRVGELEKDLQGLLEEGEVAEDI